MAISLTKGGNISLTKVAATMKIVNLGLGWDPRKTDGQKFDLDAIAFLVDAQGKADGEKGVVFFNQLNSPCGSVEHNGDNRTGDGDGDDEIITVNLDKIPQTVEKIVFAVNIHDAHLHNQTFGQVDKAYIRVLNKDNNSEELARFDLSEDSSTEAAMIFGELYRNGAEWKFRAVGQGFNGGLDKLFQHYGVM